MKKSESQKTKRTYLNQSNVPRYSLEKALSIGRAIYENYAGKPVKPLDIAIALDVKPTTGGFRSLTGASVAYGLTKGGYNASYIELTDLGKRIIAPTKEGMELEAKIEAILKPKVLGEFFQKYNNSRIPEDRIIKNVLNNMGVPLERTDSSLMIINENAHFTGIIKEIRGSQFISMSNSEDFCENDSLIELGDTPKSGKTDLTTENFEIPGKVNVDVKIDKNLSQPQVHKKPKVFITHGKNKGIVNQLKEILEFGKFQVIVSVDNETSAIPVPLKVMSDMRTCNAGVIHIEAEQKLLDEEGNFQNKINENVLIEIGAAMALYENNFILLVQKGINLPSNLQGLYICYYEGEKLDYEATMKLLKTFNAFTIF